MAQSEERLEINNLRQEAEYLYEDTSTLHQKLQACQCEKEHLQENLRLANGKADKFEKECEEKDRFIQCILQQNTELKKQLSKSQEDKDLHHVTLQKLLSKKEESRLLKKLNQEYIEQTKELQWEKGELLERCLDYERLRKIELDTERILRHELLERGHWNDKLEERLQTALEQILILERRAHEVEELGRRNAKLEEELQRARDRIQLLERHVHAQPQPDDVQCPEQVHGHLEWIAGDFFCGRCYDLICHPGRRGTRRNASTADNLNDNLSDTFQNRRLVVAGLM